MTHHICCRECDFEALVEDDDEAGDKAWTHAEATGHRVASDSIDGGAEMVTDGGRDTAGTLRTEIKCLACGNRAEELEEHHLHMARASHRDKGETWVRPSS